MNAHRCECGEVTGQPCGWRGEIDETTILEFMPECWRDSHRSARNHGTWPDNGALRLRISKKCVAALASEWTRDIGPGWRRT
jgi:hypothetical protein